MVWSIAGRDCEVSIGNTETVAGRSCLAKCEEEQLERHQRKLAIDAFVILDRLNSCRIQVTILRYLVTSIGAFMLRVYRL